MESKMVAPATLQEQRDEASGDGAMPWTLTPGAGSFPLRHREGAESMGRLTSFET